MSTRFDAIIIGGGPAGSMTALHLAQLGWQTALIERGPRNRDKSCGHCLNPRAVSLLRQLGLDSAVHAIAAGVTRHLHVHGAERREIDVPLSASMHRRSQTEFAGAGWIVSRRLLDQLLMDEAERLGVVVYQPATAAIKCQFGTSPTVLVTHGDRHIEIRASVVIGADGLGSSVARSAGLAAQRAVGRNYGFSFDTHFADACTLDPETVHMFVLPAGYLGIIRTNTGELHLAGLVRSTANRTDRDPFGFARAVARQFQVLKGLGMHMVDEDHASSLVAAGPMPWRPAMVANESIALVGDAAGYVEPFTGEGMTWAMRSAEVLASVLHDVRPGTWNMTLARRYQRAWAGTIGQRQRTCRAAAFALARPWLTRRLLGAGSRHPALARRVIQWVHT